MTKSLEDSITTKILGFIPPQDISRWNKTVSMLIKKKKADPMDDFETDFIDIDTLFSLYVEQFKQGRQVQ